MPSTPPGSPARVSSRAKWIVSDAGAIRYSSGSIVGLPAGTRTPRRITLRPTDPDERRGGHAQPAAGLEARQRSMGAHPDRADGVVRQVAQQQADPDGPRLDKTPVVVEGLEDDRVRLRGHADVAEPGGGPQHRERDVDADDTAAGADRVEHHQRRLAGASGQVEHALATFDARRTQQCRQERARPAPDEGVVGAGDVVEGDRHHVLRYAASTARAMSRVLARPPWSGVSVSPSR